MRKVICVLALALFPLAAGAADKPDWLYGVIPPNLPRPDPNAKITVPGSDKEYTEQQVNNPFNPPDWFPGDHGPMPKVVASGAQPDVRACAMCHLTTGDGHPESAGVSGLSANYIVRQLQEYKNGNRKGIRTGTMVGIGKAITDEDAKAAAEYFAARKPTVGYTKVVEQEIVPKSYVGEGAMRFAEKDGTEPIGNRLIEVPQNEPDARARNPRVGFVTYVAPGTIEKGRQLATTGGNGKTIQCTICHGPGLKGLGEVPAIANRSPMYVARQLNDIQNGDRTGAAVALMQQVVAKLTMDDMVALAAYVGSLEP